MNNLELHNKLLALAKQVRELKEQHPELAPELHPLTETLGTSTGVAPSHPVRSSPYRKGD